MAGSLHLPEIQKRIRRGYLERLGPRIKRMRKFYSERSWPELREECTHIKNTALRFGFPTLAQLAEQAEDSIPSSELSKAQGIPEARKAVENFLAAADHVLTTDSLVQN